MDLKGKVIIVTGARRIGQTVAEELAKKGANLAITYRSSKEESEAICTACVAAGVEAKPFLADLSSEEEIYQMVAAVKKEYGRIDGVVHMAAPYPKTPLENITLEQASDIFKSIAGSALILGRCISEHLKQNPGDVKGKMIFFSDWSVLTNPYPEYLAYNGAKAAVEAITKTLAKSLAPDVTVNAIAPGPILRPPDLSEAENKEALAGTPLAKWGGAEEIAKAVLYLMDADFVTGVILPVDGGRSIG